MYPIYFQSILQSSVVSKFHDKVSFWINEWKLPIDDQRELHQLVSDLLSKDGKEEVCTYMTITYYIISYLSYHTYHIILIISYLSYHIISYQMRLFANIFLLLQGTIVSREIS